MAGGETTFTSRPCYPFARPDFASITGGCSGQPPVHSHLDAHHPGVLRLVASVRRPKRPPIEDRGLHAAIELSGTSRE